MIDTHCHLQKEDYENVDKVIKNMGKNIMIVSGIDVETSKEVIKLTEKYNNVYGVIGFHPEELDKYSEDGLNYIESNITNPKIVGIGEIGLDYHYTKENKDLQKEVFIKQIHLANKYNKPIVIHSRDAAEDTYEILKQELKGNKAVLHCYSYSLEMAKKFLEMNIRFGIGGVITFKNNVKLKEVVENIDLKYLLLETDSPYLSPEPFRGQTNEPKNIEYVAKKIAEIKDMPVEEVYDITTSNACEQFDIVA